jgi:predicted nucleic acid-binding protein
MKAVIDTNILIDYLSGVAKAKEELDSYDELYISFVTWMEILVGAEGEEEAEIRDFLRRFHIHPVDEAIAERAVSLEREHKMRLPDAIIWATARELGVLLVTRNTRDFNIKHPGIRVPYRT